MYNIILMSLSPANLLEIQQEILKSETILFKPLRQESLRRGVTEDSALIHIIDILTNETYESYTQKGLTIEKKYLSKLKSLSILTYFYGSARYSLNVLASKLSLSSEQCLKALMELSISKLVLISIDEKHNRVVIHKSSIRQREYASHIMAVDGKLNQIKDKNDKLGSYIKDLIETNEKKAKVEVEDRRYDLPAYESIPSILRSSHSHRL